jgi:SWI/SNF-related matrix-associated actin-dependent regulator 1 of chromatin subfamily A
LFGKLQKLFYNTGPQAAEAISKGAKRMILLSGTPALSRPMELYSQIGLIDPALFPYFHDFGMRYCDGRKDCFGGKEIYNFSGSSNMQELKLIMEERFQRLIFVVFST